MCVRDREREREREKEKISYLKSTCLNTEEKDLKGMFQLISVKKYNFFQVITDSNVELQTFE